MILLFAFALIPLSLSSISAMCAEEYGDNCVDTKGVLIKSPSPYSQLQNGILKENIICNDGRELIFKLTNNMPACVFPHSIEKLIERGWAKPVD